MDRKGFVSIGDGREVEIIGDETGVEIPKRRFDGLGMLFDSLEAFVPGSVLKPINEGGEKGQTEEPKNRGGRLFPHWTSPFPSRYSGRKA